MTRPRLVAPLVAPWCLTLALSVGACSDDSELVSPTDPGPLPTATPAPAPTVSAHFVGDARLKGEEAVAACGWPSPARTLSGDWLMVAVSGNITASSGGDLDGAWYTGNLSGLEFVTQWDPGIDAVGACDYRETWFTGHFAADFRSFEAYQTDVYGPPQSEKTIEYRWSARRRDS